MLAAKEFELSEFQKQKLLREFQLFYGGYLIIISPNANPNIICIISLLNKSVWGYIMILLQMSTKMVVYSGKTFA